MPFGKRRAEPEREAYSGAPASWEAVDVTRLQLGIDWRSRRDVQARLEELARSGATLTDEGLVTMLRQTVEALRNAKIAWLYAHVDNMLPTHAEGAEQRFRSLALDARAAFTEELVRSAGGQFQERAASAMRARSEEGEGAVVVSVVVASRALELSDVDDPTDVAALEHLLAQLDQVAQFGSLMALEVVWSPAAEEDRMSTAELEQHYPALRKIDDAAIGGRRFCAYCRGPFPEELGGCPHCGAPVASA